MKVKFKKLHDNAVLPKYAKDGDAGMDLTVTGYEQVSNQLVKYKFGLAVEIPKGHVGLLFPRSSVYKKSLLLSNSVGVIDSGYRGEIMAIFNQLSYNIYDIGERAVQLVIMPYPNIEPEWANELSETERGEGGYGSTDKVDDKEKLKLITEHGWIVNSLFPIGFYAKGDWDGYQKASMKITLDDAYKICLNNK